MKRILTLLLIVFSSLSYAHDIKDLWMQTSHDVYKAKLFRILGREHAQDFIQVDIFKRLETGKLQTIKTIDLPSPGYKGYVDSFSFKSVGSDRVALSIHIEMKAMDDLVLTEIYLIDNSGKFKQVTEAKYVDLYQEM